MKKSTNTLLILFLLMFNSCSNSQEYKEYHENGKIYKIGKLNKNKISVGEWKIFDENEKLIWLIQYTNKGKATGEWKEYYENGKIKKIENYIEGKATGEWKEYYEDGKLYKIENYEDDYQTGECKNYWSNGTIKEIGNYKEGMATGEWKDYWSDGQVKTSMNYKNGKKTGEWKEYFDDGTLMTIGTYKNNEKTGEWKKYWSDGILSAITYYTKGEKTGEWKEYYRSGKIAEIGKYKHKKTGEWKSYYKNGQIKEIGKYDYGMRVGYWKFYDAYGKLIETKNYNNTSKSQINHARSKIKLNSIVASFEKPNVYLAITPNLDVGIEVYINGIKITPKEFERGGINATTSSPITHYLKPGKNKISFKAWSRVTNVIEEQSYRYDTGIELRVRDEAQGRSSEVIINKTSISILDCSKIGDPSSIGIQSKDVIDKVLSGDLNQKKSMNIEKTQLSTEIIEDNIIWTVSYVFTWHSKLPAPKWATSETIRNNEETHREVFKAYKKIHKILQNEDYKGWLELNDEKYNERSKLSNILLKDAIIFDANTNSINQLFNNKEDKEQYILKPLDYNTSSMDIIADGKLVRLQNKNGYSIIQYTSKSNKNIYYSIDFYLRKQDDEWVISRNKE